MSIQIDIDYSEFEQSLQAAASKIGFGAEGVVKKEVEQIMEVSEEQVPVDSGALLSTAFIETQSSMFTGTATFGYSGNAINSKTGESVADYMVAVHERLDLQHPHGKAKFLEDPINEYMDQAESSIGSKIADLFGSIFGK